MRRGFLKLMQGGPNRAYLFIGDSGFDFHLPREVTRQGILSPRQFCEQHDIPFFVPFTARSEFGLSYDAATHRLTHVPADQAEVSVLPIYHFVFHFL